MSICIADFLKSGTIVSLPRERLLIAWGKRSEGKWDDFEERTPIFYIPDFFLRNDSPWVHYSQWAEISIQEFKERLESPSDLSTCDWTINHPEHFVNAFSELQALFQKGILKKAVPYLFARSFNQMTKERLQNCLKKGLLSLLQKAGYLYGHWNDVHGMLGITPEILFSHFKERSQIVETMALAGTCHSKDSRQSFMKNEKEIEEHQFVVQGICQSLQSLGSVQVGAMQLHQLPKLAHLMTPIQLKLNRSFQFEALVRALHPTPALGALPKERGRKWLEDYQQHTPRHYYGAPFGFRYPQAGLSNCLVAIRNVQWNSSGMWIGAGCGVIKQSQFEREWMEIQFKIRAIRELLYL